MARLAPYVIALVATSLALQGCGGSSGDSDGTNALRGADTETFSITLAGGQVDGGPKQLKVKRGEKVVIDIASDETDDVHLHGIDIEARVGPDESGRLEFAAKDQGSYELEAHDSGVVLGAVVVS